MYLLFVPVQIAGCSFVPMASAKEFRRWGIEGEKEGGGVGMPMKPSPSPRGMCSGVFHIASLGVLSAALALNWI